MAQLQLVLLLRHQTHLAHLHQHASARPPNPRGSKGNSQTRGASCWWGARPCTPTAQEVLWRRCTQFSRLFLASDHDCLMLLSHGDDIEVLNRTVRCIELEPPPSRVVTSLGSHSGELVELYTASLHRSSCSRLLGGC